MNYLKIFVFILLASGLSDVYGQKENVSDHQNSPYLNAMHSDGYVFRKNAGQWDEDIYYRSVTSNSSISFFDHKVSFGLQKVTFDPSESKWEGELPSPEAEFLVWEMEFSGANNVAPVASRPTNRNLNYFGPNAPEGNKIREYRELTYTNLYNGVDMRMYNSEEQQFKYDVIVHPGGDIQSFTLTYKGIESISVNNAGELVIHTAWGDLREAKPYSYQVINGKQVEVQVRYVVRGSNVGYEITGAWDPSRDLIIDPIYVDWSSFVYGDPQLNPTWGWTWVLDADIDEDEAVYITGMCWENYPTKPGAYDTARELYDAYVAKISPKGDSLIWFTYLGGSSYDYGLNISVNSQKQPVVSGLTYKNDFPTTPGAFDRTGKNCGSGWCYQSYVTKFDSSGSSLIFSTFLTGTNGGAGWSYDWIRGMYVDGSGDVFVCGNTTSSNYPTTAGAFQKTFGGESSTIPGQDWSVRGDAFLTKIKADGTGLIFSTFLGGALNEAAFDIFVNGKGEIYVVGATNSNNFPTTPAAPIFNTVPKGTGDGFVSKFKADGSGLLYSVMIGGTGYERFEGIYSNGFDEPYVTGYSNSSNFPVTTKAYQKNNKGGDDWVVFKMPSSGTNMIYSTYIGGSLNESTWSSPFFDNVTITANVREEAIISGVTRSSDFPVTADALQKTKKSQNQWYGNTAIVKLSYGGDQLLYGSYWGGSNFEYPGAVKTKRVGCVSFILLGGITASTDYPTTTGAWREDPKNTTTGWSYSGYISKLRDTLYTDPIDLALGDTIIECDLVFEVLDAKNQGADILWSHGPTTRTVIIKDTGTYYVRATYGCDTVWDTVNVQLQYRPIVPVFGNDTTYCDSFPTVYLDAKNDTILSSYEWMDGDTNQIYAATQPGKYKVTIHTPNCGSKSDEINLAWRNTPKLDIEDSIFCNDVSIVLDAGNMNNDVIYRWYNGDTSQSVQINDTGTYYVVLSNICGTDSTSFTYDMLTTPVASLPDDSVFCNSINWLLKQGKEDNEEWYYWSSPDGLVTYGVDDSLLIKTQGAYKVYISNKCGFSDDTVFVGLISTPTEALTDTIYTCNTVNETLKVGVAGNQETYLWSTNANTPSINVNTAGLYTVVLSNKCGKVNDSSLIILKETPTVQLPADSVFCDNINITLDATFPDDEATYAWSGGETTPVILVTDPGTYKITITNRCGVVSDEMTIDKILSPTVDLGIDMTFCGNVIPQNYTVGLDNNQESYDWSNGSTYKSQTLGEGKHWVTISNKCATVSDTIVLRAVPFPVVDLGPDTILCGNFSLLLDAGNPGMTYAWAPFGQTTQTINATEQVVYTVTVTNSDGCSSSDDFEIGSSCISSFHIPTAFSPNADGLNDEFKPTLVNFENYSMLIFNRWGEIVFETENANEGWDGTYKGETVMTGVYFYRIRFITTEDGNFQTLTGVIRVIR